MSYPDTAATVRAPRLSRRMRASGTSPASSASWVASVATVEASRAGAPRCRQHPHVGQQRPEFAVGRAGRGTVIVVEQHEHARRSRRRQFCSVTSSGGQHRSSSARSSGSSEMSGFSTRVASIQSVHRARISVRPAWPATTSSAFGASISAGSGSAARRKTAVPGPTIAVVRPTASSRTSRTESSMRVTHPGSTRAPSGRPSARHHARAAMLEMCGSTPLP